MIGHKISPRTPDEVCSICPQCYEGNCCAYNLPHSEEERKARTQFIGFKRRGMECDPPSLKRIRMARFGSTYKVLP